VPAVVVCTACDLVHQAVPSPARNRTQCVRCRATLHNVEAGSLDRAFALTVSSLMVYLLANVYPLVEIHMSGTTRTTTLPGAALGLAEHGFSGLGALVLLTTCLAPLAQIMSLLYLLAPLRRSRRARHQRLVFRCLTHVREWTFFEVFILGALVALVRLTAYAKVIPGVSLVCCGVLMIMLAALTNMTSPQQFWHWVERSRR
jgi:paraquat-inducible protein A